MNRYVSWYYADAQQLPPGQVLRVDLYPQLRELRLQLVSKLGKAGHRRDIQPVRRRCIDAHVEMRHVIATERIVQLEVECARASSTA